VDGHLNIERVGLAEKKEKSHTGTKKGTPHIFGGERKMEVWTLHLEGLRGGGEDS